MPYSVHDILSWVPLTEAVEVVKTGIPKVLPPEFWNTTENVSGNTARLIEFTGTRRTARVTPYGARPSRPRRCRCRTAGSSCFPAARRWRSATSS